MKSVGGPCRGRAPRGIGSLVLHVNVAAPQKTSVLTAASSSQAAVRFPLLCRWSLAVSRGGASRDCHRWHHLDGDFTCCTRSPLPASITSILSGFPAGPSLVSPGKELRLPCLPVLRKGRRAECPASVWVTRISGRWDGREAASSLLLPERFCAYNKNAQSGSGSPAAFLVFIAQREQPASQ